MVVMMINKAIKIYLFLAVLMFSSFSFSENNESILQTANGLEHYSEVKYDTIDDVFNNLSHRLILGLFGKRALIIFLPEDVPTNIMEAIEALDKNELIQYAKPFNYELVNITLLVLFLISSIATMVMCFMMAWISLERTIITSESGDFLGKNVDSAKANIKFVLIFCLIIPVHNMGKLSESDNSMAVNVSLIQLGVIKLIGVSSYTGDKIFEIYANNTPTYYPIIEMPQKDGKYSDMVNLIKYSNCVNSESINDDINDIPFNFRRVGAESYEATSGSELCELEIKITFDNKTELLIQNNKEISSMVPFNSYLDVQYIEFRTIMSELLYKANIISKNIVNGDLDSTIFSSSEEEIINKYKNCEDIYKPNLDITEDKDAIQYLHKAAKCLSYDFINDFSKIPSMDYYLDNKNSEDVEMCSNRLISVKEVGGIQTEIDSKETIVNKKNLEEFGDVTGISEYSQKKVEDCIKDYCSDFSSSSIYQCSNAIGLGYEHYSRKNMSKKGWMTSGAYIYKIFSNITTNSNGKLPITSFHLNFKKNTVKKSVSHLLDGYAVKNVGSEIGDYNQNLRIIHTDFYKNENQQEEVEDFSTSMSVLLQQMLLRSSDVDNPQAIMSDLSKYVTEDIMRLNTCLKNPLEITSGISCGNITTEINRIGNKILNIAIYLKISLLAAELKNTVSDASAPSGSVSGEGTSILTDLVKSKTVWSLVALSTFSLDYIFELIEGTGFNSSFVESQSFNKIMIATSGAVAFYAADGNGKIMNVFNAATWVLFIIGIALTFVIPLIPFTLWALAVIGWLISVFQLLINLPLWAATTMSVSEQNSAESMKVGIRMLISMIIRIPLMVIGLIIAWLLTNIFVQRILSEEMIGFAMNYGDNGLIFMGIDYFLILVIYVIMLITIYNILFSLIEGFHELAMNWMGDKEGSGKILGKEGGETTAAVGRFKAEASRLKGLKWKLGKA
jgi:conjugal transfer/type IV secretion protein DotA/TraY